MSQMNLDALISKEVGSQVALAMLTIGRFHNVKAVLAEWLQNHNVEIVPNGDGWRVVHFKEGFEYLVGRHLLFEQALIAALEQVDADMQAAGSSPS